MKRWFSVVLALLMCLSLFGCGQKAPAKDTTQVNTDQASELPPADSAPSVEVPPAQTPVTPPEEPLPEEPAAPQVPEVTEVQHDANFADTDNVSKILDAKVVLPYCEELPKINAYYQALWDDLYATCQLNREDALIQKTDFAAWGQEFTPWQTHVTFEIVRNDGVTLSVLREIYENTGGMHPLFTYQSETFDIATQGRLLLGNLFTVSEEEYLARLQDMILALMSKRETEDGIYYYDSAREDLLNLLDPMDFALTEDSLLIFFDVYALAPYAAGPQQFYLPLADLADIIKPQYLTE